MHLFVGLVYAGFVLEPWPQRGLYQALQNQVGKKRFKSGDLRDMSMTDPIADMLARIRNAVMVKHESLEMPSSKLKLAIAKLMKEEGFIDYYRLVKEGGKDKLKITLSYFDGRSAINGLRRVSKPGRRVYCKADDIPVVNKGIGIAVISTSRGVMTDSQARQAGIGGEILLTVW